jgi:hypothetical protein
MARDMVPGERCVAGFTGMVMAGDRLVVFDGVVFPLAKNGAATPQPEVVSGSGAKVEIRKRGQSIGQPGEVRDAILRVMLQHSEPLFTADVMRLMNIPLKHERRGAIQQGMWRLSKVHRWLEACPEDRGKSRPRYVLSKAGRAAAEKLSTPAA